MQKLLAVFASKKQYTGFGDIIVPDRIQMEFPVVLSDEHMNIYAYSQCSSVAERFKPIISLGHDNSRFKDLYGLYVLAHQADFYWSELLTAVSEPSATGMPA